MDAQLAAPLQRRLDRRVQPLLTAGQRPELCDPGGERLHALRQGRVAAAQLVPFRLCFGQARAFRLQFGINSAVALLGLGGLCPRLIFGSGRLLETRRCRREPRLGFLQAADQLLRFGPRRIPSSLATGLLFSVRPALRLHGSGHRLQRLAPLG